MNESATDNLETPLASRYHINRVIADTASDAIITIDEKSTMLFVNRAAEKDLRLFARGTSGTIFNDADA